MCTKYMLFYTAFIIKEHFQIFREMVQKPWKIQGMSAIFCQTCLHVDRLLKKMKQNSCGNSYVFTFVGYLCFIQISSSLWGLATALHTGKVEPR